MKPSSLKLIVLSGGLALLAAPAIANTHGAAEKFQRMDANGDGRLTETEHSQFVERMFQQCDANGDGQLSSDELKAEARDHQGMDQKAVSSHVNLVDTSGDQEISRAENATYAENMFKRADKNNDGILHAGEFEAQYQEMKQKMKP